jgi:deoxycytidine triphosphate deaminase
MPEPESTANGLKPDQRGEQDSKLNPKSLQDAERERLRNFPNIPDNPAPEDAISNGVLLSDQIKRLVNKYQMIHPFDEEKSLKAASYELRVGAKYGRAGISYPLADKQVVTIQPFDVVLIQTLETLNLPRFLIARWNIRIKWAYKGLLWVGAPQVDPGFRGFLSCPLYNLSSNPVDLEFGEQFAAIDFVRTTEVTPDSKPYKWDERTRMVFEDYEVDKLESALVTRAAKRLAEMGRLTAVHAQTLLNLDQAVKSNEASIGTQIQAANQRLTDTRQQHSLSSPFCSQLSALRLPNPQSSPSGVPLRHLPRLRFGLHCEPFISLGRLPKTRLQQECGLRLFLGQYSLQFS